MSEREIPIGQTARLTQERHGQVAVITLSRPGARNAVDAAMSREAGAALRALDDDPSCRVVVLTGAGDTFCAGADLKALARGEAITHPQHPEWGFAGMVRQATSTPLVAAVNGPALGGGTELVLNADVVVMDEEARLGLPEVRRGLTASEGGVLRLVRQAPYRVALGWLLTGEQIDATTALSWGLVNEVAPAGTSVERALAWAETIAANAPLSVTATRTMARASADPCEDVALWRGQDELAASVASSHDAREGAIAFSEKREPRWQGR